MRVLNPFLAGFRIRREAQSIETGICGDRQDVPITAVGGWQFMRAVRQAWDRVLRCLPHISRPRSGGAVKPVASVGQNGRPLHLPAPRNQARGGSGPIRWLRRCEWRRGGGHQFQPQTTFWQRYKPRDENGAGAACIALPDLCGKMWRPKGGICFNVGGLQSDMGEFQRLLRIATSAATGIATMMAARIAKATGSEL